MKYRMFLMTGVIFLLAALILPIHSFAQDKPAQDIAIIKKGCIKATIKAINLEIERNKGWIEHGNAKTKEAAKKRIQQLKAELAKYQTMNVADYELPEKLNMEAWFDGPAGDNAILYCGGMTRSGPWYQVSGIRGNDYSIIKPHKKYHMVIYLVYPQEYFWMTSYYVYIAQIK